MKYFSAVLAAFLIAVSSYAQPDQDTSGNIKPRIRALFAKQPNIPAPITRYVLFTSSQGTRLIWGGNGNTELTSDSINAFIGNTGRSADRFVLTYSGTTSHSGWEAFKHDKARPRIIAGKLADLVNNTSLTGINIDIDIPYSTTTFKSNFYKFVSVLDNRLGADKNIELDLPPLSACTASSKLEVCQGTYKGYPGWGSATWLLSGQYNIQDKIDIYNILTFVWRHRNPEKAIHFTRQNIELYVHHGIPYSAINLGLIVKNTQDIKRLKGQYMQTLSRYSTNKSLMGIFVWHYSNSESHAKIVSVDYSFLGQSS